ncbi:hypothetical protein DASB73_026200 [Starmerella bacillaris]|uniref:Dolichol-phosphate mannosyltransferase subunit 3 n=1 Tax=Starmerella bacillaris TaxID=1247836 RepID=A0AAV5RKR4_STABA|nr:hypothetical protein DASB73_026200 [Starmerella bacillaris]
MTKATETAAFFSILFSAWLALYVGFIPLPTIIHEQIVPVLPWWSLVTFGAYSLGTLGYDVLTFNDKPQKYKELMAQIKEAKADLKAQGISISE